MSHKSSMSDRVEVIDDMVNIHMIKNAIQPPFKHPAPSLVKFWTEIGLVFPAIELTWMFDLRSNQTCMKYGHRK